MTNRQIVAFARSFRSGMLGNRGRADLMGFAVCAPLAALLRLHGVDCELHETDLEHDGRFDVMSHYWIRLADGRALDPTADQFEDLALPRIYLGEARPDIHRMD